MSEFKKLVDIIENGAKFNLEPVEEPRQKNAPSPINRPSYSEQGLYYFVS